MTHTFTNDPSGSNRDLIRLLAYDTDSSNSKLSDEMIAYLLSSEASVWYAAAAACDMIAGQVGRAGSLTVGDLSIDYPGGGDYKSLAKTYRQRGSRAAVPFAGGISQSAKDAETSSVDRVAPAFSIGMHDNTRSTGT